MGGGGVRLFLVLASFLTAACDPENSASALSATSYQQNGLGQAIRYHTPNGSYGVSADGEVLVFTDWMLPANELLLVDRESNDVWILRHPVDRIRLSDPAISPDGKRIAFIASLGVSAGMGEIWITDLDGENALILRDDRRAFRQPDFSPDGAALSYFRDVLPLAQSRGASFRSLVERTDLPWSIFVAEFGTRSHTRVMPLATPIPKDLFWSEMGLTAVMFEPAFTDSDLTQSRDGSFFGRWLERVDGLNDREWEVNFLLSDWDSGEIASEAIRLDLPGEAEVQGVSFDGRHLVHHARTLPLEGNCLIEVFFFFEAKQVRVDQFDRCQPQSVRLSRDGRTIVARHLIEPGERGEPIGLMLGQAQYEYSPTEYEIIFSSGGRAQTVVPATLIPRATIFQLDPDSAEVWRLDDAK